MPQALASAVDFLQLVDTGHLLNWNRLGNQMGTPATRSTTIKEVSERLGQHCCNYCCSKNNLTIDHIIPLSSNGLDGISNFQILCFKCNQNKGSNIRDDMEMVLPLVSVRTLFHQVTSNDFGSKYSKAVFDSAFNKLDCGAIPVKDIFSFVEYANAYGLPGLLYKRRVISIRHFKFVPKTSKFIVKFDPKFILSEDANSSFGYHLVKKHFFSNEEAA